MLGKGLESLIPQKPQHPSDASLDSTSPSALPAASPLQAQAPSQAQPHIQSQQQPIITTSPKLFEARPVAAIQTAAPSKKEEPQQQSSIFHIELDKITPNPDQPRRNFDQDALRELANSIREFGFLQPLVVSQIKKETLNGIEVEYQIIAGERRYHAAKLLGLARVPAIVRNVSLEREKLELGVIENIQRENLNPIETARAFQRLQEEFRMTQREIAAKLGKSREVVANAVRLLDLPEYVQKALEQGEVSESNARLLLNVEDPGAQQQLLNDIIQNKLTTRDVRERVQHNASTATIGSGARRGRPPMQEMHLAPEVRAMQDDLSTSLGAPVEISKTAHNGKISITFFSEEELENILRRLGKEGE